MLHLLKIEWLKVKNYRTFWVLSILFMVSIFGINYIMFNIQNTAHINAGTGPVQKPEQAAAADTLIKKVVGSPFDFPEVWQSITYVSGFLLFIPGLLIITSITNEYTYKTHRQNIIDGLSRTQFIFVKMLLTVIIALAATLFVFLTAVGFGLSGGSSFSFDKIEYVGYFFIQALSYTAFALLTGIVLKRSGVAIGLFFLYSLVLENMLSGLLNHYFNPVGSYLPLETTDRLIRFPFFRRVVEQLVKAPPPVSSFLLMSAIYLTLYFFLCKRKLETADL
ncbi:ABC transporter permease [Deminuibacter soli]|uniref:Uncharacterized protein n=1 Tax=Deminuibacter soli TaxID=2291815 RepID=A0A3E1NE11_9BACT|nr:ABC transporter permease subunit [Deminuibacter soli]RFM26196.1 hypothetical protein DXN05_21615 [Deminuibacter soli]